ncbi:MAG TPA: type III pantothenate kinase [Pyrinomonadaceae bacterium]|nr:type III pantothenate kinase [Pyrinomonadaceae bacterium]
MLLAIDIGNSAVKFGVFDGGRLFSTFSIPTKRESAAGEIASAIASNLEHSINSIIICSVVPEIESAMTSFLKDRFGIEPFYVRSDLDFGLKIIYEPRSAVGSDRLVNAFAAVGEYGKPIIVCSLGTATTIDAVSEAGEFLGGAIAPGLKTMAESLHLKASRLPLVEIIKPENVIGNSTVASIRSGIFYGYLGLVEGILTRMIAEFGKKPNVIATGGFGGLIAANCKMIDNYDEYLILSGLNKIAATYRS